MIEVFLLGFYAGFAVGCLWIIWVSRNDRDISFRNGWIAGIDYERQRQAARKEVIGD